MTQKFLGLFTGTHLTLITMTAIVAPSVLWAAGTYTSVAIQDTSGRQAVVGAGNLHVNDPIGNYAQSPDNFVEIKNLTFSSSACKVLYTVPSGKALIITGMTGNLYNSSSSATTVGVSINTDNSCSYFSTVAETANYLQPGTSSPMEQHYDRSIIVRYGSVVSINVPNNNGYVFIHGYLVPSSAVPAAAPQANSAPVAHPPVGRTL